MIGFNVQDNIFPLAFNYLKAYLSKFYSDIEFIQQDFAFGNRSSYGINSTLELHVISYILLEKPVVVCFSSYIWNSQMIKNISLALKKLSDVKIVIGGPEADSSFESFADCVIIGEGELKFKRYIDSLHKVSSSDDSLSNLDDIPFPYKFHSGKKDYTAMRIETTRGCPFACSYCNYANTSYREFSIPYLEENIKYLFNNFTFRNLTILDSNFNLKKDRMQSILRIISKYADKQSIYVELKPEFIDKDVISIIKNSKLNIYCELGLQSVSSEVLDSCFRSYDLEKVKYGLDLLNKSGIKYKIDMMYGLSKDNFFRFLRTVNFIKKYSRKKKVAAHHHMQLNNTVQSSHRYIADSSSMVIKTDSQDALDLYKQKLFLDLLNNNNNNNN